MIFFFYRSNSKILQVKGINTPRKDNSPLLQCTHHMCPIRVHWHVKLNYKDYWRVKIAVTNFNYRMNHTLWSLVVQHPNLNNVTQVFSFDYKPLLPYESISKCQKISICHASYIQGSMSVWCDTILEKNYFYPRFCHTPITTDFTFKAAVYLNGRNMKQFILDHVNQYIRLDMTKFRTKNSTAQYSN